MSWDDDGNEAADDDEGYLEPLPPDDRLWRHPSEVAGGPASAGTLISAVMQPARSASIWAVAGAAGLIGAVFTMGVITLIGGLEPRVVERQVVERVAIPPIVGVNSSSNNGGIADVAARISPAIARIEVERDDRISTGSAVVFRDNGYLMTNAHVVEGARSVQVELGRQHYEAEVVGLDPLTDIAVLKIDAEGLPTVVLGEEVELRVGEPAIAIGSPAGLAGGPSVTTGVVSALGRRVVGPDDRSLHDMIQFDAPITAGSSGGALVDGRGAVIGITTAIAVTDFGAEGLGFATPIDIARKVADDIIETGGPRHPWLGVEGRDLDMASVVELGLSGGAMIVGVTDDGPAATAGLEAGDIIVSIDGVETATMSAVVVIVRDHDPADAVEVAYLRNGEPQVAIITLAERAS